MDLSRVVEEILLIVCREVLRLAELELKRFTDALEDWVNQLLSERLPGDWRQRMHSYLDAWDAEFEVAAEDRPILENWIEGWARLRDLLPDDKGPSPAQSAAEFLESAYAQQALTSYFGDRLALPHMDYLTTDAPEARVTGVREIKGLGAWYDEARKGGYKPWFHTRVAVAVARELLPDSEPTMVITYSDGRTEIVMGGGPTSGAMAGQAATLAGIGIAASKGKLIAELGENAADTAFQEATDSPVGAPRLKSPRRIMLGAKAPAVEAPRTNRQLVEDIATRAEEKVNQSGNVAGTHKHTHAKKVVFRYQRMFGDRGLKTEVSVGGGRAVEYGTKDSVRLDVVEGDIANPTAIYDYKFGTGTLSDSRVQQIRRAGNFGPEVPVIEVHRDSKR